MLCVTRYFCASSTSPPPVPSLLTVLLLPLSWLYAGVMAVRNMLYRSGLNPSVSFPEVPVLNVGNLRVGGTGKTPHVAHLITALQQLGQSPAMLSRGYGRRTRGYRFATATDTAATIGDEPLQQFQQFKGTVPVAVCEDRVVGIRQLLSEAPATSVVVLDDAYQHRRVQPSFNILLTEQERPFYEDWVLPAGRLRESRAGAVRADLVIVTKCDPLLSEARRQDITRRIRSYAKPTVPVLFSTYVYGTPVAIGASPQPTGPEVLLLTGIAQPEPLRQYLETAGYRVVHHARFADHHAFTEAEIAAVAAQLAPGQSVFTTQKDAARLLEPALAAVVVQVPVFYLPIDVRFLADGDARLLELLMPYFQPHAVV
ncbi:tetraacyldisaccharide 4'-kinase [Hymenobacter wooponensis]|uniref:Tetraacyldisaccharide 4'-kinase n=1 Tax=Hymenobacter wooponensis TaxID=1525360 RepID=A0A4Z0MIL4_9BACT|nr:tetraacyldisaccharide 4'-kinase [Hymenobacter wooponensis]